MRNDSLCVICCNNFQLDPALVFGEFMGVIKGSGDTIGAKHRHLDQEAYKQLSV